MNDGKIDKDALAVTRFRSVPIFTTIYGVCKSCGGLVAIENCIFAEFIAKERLDNFEGERGVCNLNFNQNFKLE